MIVKNLGKDNSVLGSFVAELRDSKVQKDSMRFRRNLERVGEIFAYELSKTLDYSEKEVKTPLGTATVRTPDDKLVISTVLRAGLPIQQGLLNFFDKAETAFVAAYRKYGKGDYFEIRTDYCNCPSIEGKILVITDAMIASGSSIEIVRRTLIEEGGAPVHTHIFSPIASSYGVDYLSTKLGDDVTLWLAAVDEELTSHSYIVPGLGDAGDLAYGPKL